MAFSITGTLILFTETLNSDTKEWYFKYLKIKCSRMSKSILWICNMHTNQLCIQFVYIYITLSHDPNNISCILLQVCEHSHLCFRPLICCLISTFASLWFTHLVTLEMIFKLLPGKNTHINMLAPVQNLWQVWCLFMNHGQCNS